MKFKKSVILKKIFDADWIFGYNNPIDRVKLTNNWWQHKPTDETQRYARFDPWDCTSRAKCNSNEFLFNYKIKNNLFSERAISFLSGDNCLRANYFDDKGNINFLDKFPAILSGTVPGVGNTFKAPADIIRQFGLVPESAFPWKDIEGLSVEEYYKESTIEFLKPLGKEFLDIFQINYELVYPKDFDSAIYYSPIECGVMAWLYNGTYYYSDGRVNHDCVIANIPSHFEIYDSYSPYIKNLSPNYDFMDFGYVWFVKEKQKNMILKDKHKYTAIIGAKDGIPAHKEYGFAKAGKLIVGDRDEILNLFIDENGGNIEGRVTTVLEKDFYSVPFYNTKLEKIKD